jgi:hypothetical protein
MQLLATFGASTTDGTTNGGVTPLSLSHMQGYVAVVKWLDAIRPWRPLQIAAGCRYYTAAAAALKLGLIDPEQGGIVAMLASRATAASTTPWGKIEVQPPKEALSEDEEDDLELPQEAERQRQRHRLAALAHVPACPFTTKFVRAATSGWSTTRHWLHHAALREAVHTVLLLAERLRRQGAVGEVPPHMPPELWLVFACFFLRSRRQGLWRPRRCHAMKSKTLVGFNLVSAKVCFLVSFDLPFYFEEVLVSSTS